MFCISKRKKLTLPDLWLTYFVVASLLVHAKGRNNLQAKILSNRNDCGVPECKVLPPPPPTEDEKPLELFDLLARGSEILENYTDVSEAIALLGNTGSGKTTLAQILAGNLSKLHSVLTSGCHAVIIDEDDRIGLPSTKSKTLFPELVFKTDPNSNATGLAFYDFPGFDDTRGDVQDIAANFFMNQVMTKVSKVKMLFLVTHSSVNFNERKDFDLLATHASTFVKNLDKYKDSIALVVTKVASYNGMGRYIDDRTIISGIAEFLNKFLDELRSQLSNNPDQDALLLNKIKFVETLLHQDLTSNSYTKIWFVRSPLGCGPLSEQEMILHTKNNITKIYGDLDYTGINTQIDFGFTLKAETKLVMANYTRSINQGITSAVDLVIEDLHQKYFGTGNLVNFDNLNFTSLSSTMHQNSLHVKSLVDKLKTNVSNSIELSDNMQLAFRGLRYHIPTKFHSFMRWQEEYLSFFDQAIGKNQERLVDKWSEPILKINKAFLDLVDWYEFCLLLETHVSSYPFQSTKQDFPQKFPQDSWLNYIETHKIVAVTRQIKEVASRIENRDLNLLGDIMTFALAGHTEYCDRTNNAIIFEGNFIQLKKLPSPSSFTSKCGSTTTQVHIYAASKIFIDDSLNLEDFDIVMIAPIWSNPQDSEIKINLLGKAASRTYPKAASGAIGQAGSSGCMGVPGFPGGTAFGISSSIQSSFPLRIISKGGRGGRGQEGGNGGQGIQMRNARGPNQSNWDGSDKKARSRKNCWIYNPNRRWHYGFRGNDGLVGGNGGMGGVGGRAVESKDASLVLLKNRNLVQFTSMQGESGFPGVGGSGGAGGNPGEGYYCEKHCKGGWRCWGRGADCGRGRCPGNRGRNGANGNSQLCRINPQQPRQLVKWPAIVKYRTKFFNETDLTTTTFLDEIDHRSETKGLFTLKALAEESLALESVNMRNVNPKRLRDMYNSLVFRLEDFHKRNYNSLSNEHKKIVSILLSLAYSSVMNFERVQNYDVIVDVSHYFSVIERQVNSLRTLTSLKAIQEAKDTFTQNLHGKIDQALGFMENTVTPAILEAEEDLKDKVVLLENQLVSLIEDTKLTLEEMKANLRKANQQQGIMNAFKIFDVSKKLLSTFITIPDFPAFDSLVEKLKRKYAGEVDNIEKLKQLVEETEKMLAELEEKRDEFENEFSPLVAFLLEYFRNVSDALTSGKEVQRPELLLTKWEVMRKLKEVKNSLDVFADASLDVRPLINAVDRIKDAMTITIDIYEMIEQYLETASLADFISTANSALLGPIPITDPEYAHTVRNFDIKIRQNMLDVEVRKAIYAFKQWVFPFAKFYFGGQPRGQLQLLGESRQSKSSEIGAEHAKMIENLHLDLERYKTLSVGNQDTFIILTNFSSGLKTSKPFFTWKNDHWGENIQSLISGTRVNFHADVRMQGMEGWEAIKFKLIEISIKLNHAPEGMQEEFDDILEYFGVSMTHSGVSYYRFRQDYFVMTGANQTLIYNFERDRSGNRLGTNQVYEKFKKGDFLLSPYTLWTFQLRKVIPVNKGAMLRKDVGFDSLEKFLPYMDLELVGMGTYTDGEAALGAVNGDLQLDVYYERDERVNVEFKF